ncbi:MAG: hypothetical protein P4L31_00380 [Candidatus Babeliales bacterium]|nr:hypothetical protein [Candidatus Babeliales bacterium]
MFIKNILYMLIPFVSYCTLLPSDIPAGMLDRNKLFDDVMEISEDEFKQLTGTPQGQKPNVDSARKVIEQQQQLYPRAMSITQGNWAQPTLEQLRLCVNARLMSKKINPDDFGSLHLIIHDPQNLKKTHARALHEQFPNGYFQVSSNFNALEEHMGNYSYNLSTMNDAPAHGEESVLATMPAAIYRRYLLEPINLLSGLGDMFILDADKNHTPIIKGLKKSLPITSHDMRNFSVGVHHRVIATSGYNDDNKMITRENDPFNRPKPAYNKWMPDTGNGVVYVNQIFTAAHDINPKNRDDIIITQEHIEIAHAIIQATYEATVLTAVDNGAKDVVLMMLRPEVFNNDPMWVVQAIDTMSDIIIASGIRVHMVIRHRVPAVQQKFIDGMQAIIDDMEIKKSKYTDNLQLLTQSITTLLK